MWTSTVVDSLAAMGIEERNARQAIARLAEQGLVESSREGRRARWHLTKGGRELLTVGTERIYRFGADGDDWDHHWLVVLCSVPEDQRAKRHQLRSQLAFAGFGFLSAGIAISPHLDREDMANQVLRNLRLHTTAVVFRAEVGSLIAPEDLLSRAWDLDALATQYHDFVETFGAGVASDDETAFVALVDLVHAWRHFPFVDPEIPADLLPSTWPGRDARGVFDDRHAAWERQAAGFFESLE